MRRLFLGSASVPTRRYPPESGVLDLLHTHFVDDRGVAWQGRSATQFLLFARFLHGESIQPQIDWLIANWFNCCRVFGQVNWRDDFAVPLNYARPWERSDFDAQLGAFFDLLAKYGLRCEFTVLTYADDLETQRAYVQRVFDVADDRWNVFIECANEPEVNGIDPVTVMRGVDRWDVPTAYGLDPERVPGPNYFHAPVLDYATSHDLARDLLHSPRNSKDCRDAEDVVHVPVWDDEPIGVIDPTRYPQFVQRNGSIWTLPTGGSVRTTDANITTAHAAIALLLTGLTTFHCQAGLEGRTPGTDEPIQAAAGAAIGALGSIIQPEAQLGTYTRAGLSDFPIAWTPGDGDSLVSHAYASILGPMAWVVVPMPSPTWPGIVPINGWRVDAVGDVPWIARLRR